MPADPYGISKGDAEDALRTVAAETGLQVSILRPPLVYGPGMKANFLRLLQMDRSRRTCPHWMDYDADDVTVIVVRVMLSYTDYVSRTVWMKR